MQNNTTKQNDSVKSRNWEDAKAGLGRGMSDAFAIAWVGGFVFMILAVIWMFASGPPV